MANPLSHHETTRVVLKPVQGTPCTRIQLRFPCMMLLPLYCSSIYEVCDAEGQCMSTFVVVIVRAGESVSQDLCCGCSVPPGGVVHITLLL